MSHTRYALLIPLIFGLATVLSAQEQGREAPYSELVMLRKDLKSAQELVSKLPDSKEKWKLRSTLARANRRSARIQNTGIRSKNPRSLSDKRHEQVLIRLRKLAFDSEKLQLLTLTFSNTTLTCAQGKALIKKLTFDSGQYKAAVILFPHLTDLENIDDFLSGLTYSSTRDNVRRKFGIDQ